MAAKLFEEYLAGLIMPQTFELIVLQRCMGSLSLRTVILLDDELDV